MRHFYDWYFRLFLNERRIAKVYPTTSYDYPVQIQESITELSTNIGHGITNFAAQNLKGTSIPAPSPVAAAPVQPKTLPHALGRAATTAAIAIQNTSGGAQDKLGKGMQLYASAMDNVCTTWHPLNCHLTYTPSIAR